MNARLRLCLGILAAWLALAAAGPLVATAAGELALLRILAPPGPGLLLGADDLGRPLALRLAAGAWHSLLIAMAVVVATGTIGVGLGLLAGWYGGRLEQAFDQLCDLVLAFPGLLLAIALAAVLRPGADTVVIALSAAGWVGFARLARNRTRVLRQREHVQAALALGRRPAVILGVHVLPLLAGPLLVEASFTFAGAVLAEAGLSFLGLGLPAPAPSWGGMIRDGVRYMLVAPHLVIVPATALALVVLAISLLGDALADRLDVRRRRRV